MAIRKNEKQRMKDYLVAKLEGNGVAVEPKTKEILRGSGIESSYIFVGNSGIVLLVDRTYPKDSFARLHTKARKSKADVGTVFFKDGNTFFRSAEHRGHLRRDEQRSLKNYSVEEMQKLMLLRPEEIYLAYADREIQYFQPDSDKLEEGVETFGFSPAIFDYGHIPAKDRYGPVRAPSKQLFIWNSRDHNTDDLVLGENYLRSRD